MADFAYEWYERRKAPDSITKSHPHNKEIAKSSCLNPRKPREADQPFITTNRTVLQAPASMLCAWLSGSDLV